MINAWTVTTYLRSEMPLTPKVASVMSFTYIVFQDNPPQKKSIEAFASSHVRNAELLASEVAHTPIDDDFFSAD